MSAFIVSRETLNRVVMSMAGSSGTTVEEMNQLGNRLWRMNHRAVVAAYPHRAIEPPDQFEIRLCWSYTEVERLKACDCLLYVCCEGNVPDESLYKAVQSHRDDLASKIVRELPEWKTARWDQPSISAPSNLPRTMAIKQPKSNKDGFSNRLKMAYNQLIHGNYQEAEYLLTDAIDELASDRVKFSVETPTPSLPVPHYNPDEDGDYDSWLVRNNID